MPGAVLVIQTHGNLVNANPHVHCLSTDGIFTSDGIFHLIPHCGDNATKYLKELFEKKVAYYCIKKGFVREKILKHQNLCRYRLKTAIKPV